LINNYSGIKKSSDKRINLDKELKRAIVD